MEFRFNKKKEEILQAIISDINSNNYYVGDGYKIAGKIGDDKIYLNLEDRRSKSSKFFREVFYGSITQIGDTSVINGKFRIDTYPLILFIILLCVAVESLVVSLFFYGFTGNLILPVIIITFVGYYFASMKKRSKETNEYIENYLNSIVERS